LRVSRIGLGLAALGRPSYINVGRADDLGADRSIATFERRCHEMLDAAYAQGIRYVDAARSYGMAEAFLGRWLTSRGLDREDLTVGSKWGYSYVGDWRIDAPVHEIKDHSVEALRRQIAESRSWLADRLRLYQIHSATLETGVFDDDAVVGELAQLRADGLAIGLSVSGPRQRDTIRRALEIRVDGINLFQTVQATWNLLEPSAGEALADAKAEGCGVIVKEALANGRLTSRGAPSPALQEFAEACGADIAVAAMAAAVAQPWVDVVLSGAVTLEQLCANLEALDVVVPTTGLPPIAQPAADYWSHRSTLPWR
jgi:aryl-alcohol dehydrogenase-like predicted oxidoreductase